MSVHDEIDTHDTVTDPEREWGVQRCTHGCVHLALQRVTLTLTDDEFQALHELLSRAHHRFQRHGKVYTHALRAH